MVFTFEIISDVNKTFTSIAKLDSFFSKFQLARPLFFGSSGFLYQWNWPTRYNWNIVHSGVKHHQKTNKQTKFTASKYTSYVDFWL